MLGGPPIARFNASSGDQRARRMRDVLADVLNDVRIFVRGVNSCIVALEKISIGA
jgi:hypothetical protein